MQSQYVERVVDLTKPERNIIYNMSHGEAIGILKTGNTEEVGKSTASFHLFR